MSTKLIVLDVDDTLYLERDYVKSGFSAVSKYMIDNFGYGEFFNHAWKAFEEGQRRTIFDDIMAEIPEMTPTPPAVNELVKIYRNHRPEISLSPDAEGFLNVVHESFDLGVVTDGPAASQRGKIQALRLDRWISEFVVTDEHGADWPKPSILPFLELQEHFSVQPEYCWYLADNPAKDFIGPANLGWRTIRVRRNLGLHYDAPDHAGQPADFHVEDLSEAYKYLRQ